MTSLAGAASSIVGADGRAADAAVTRATFWRKLAAETVFVFGLCALCVALVALRIAVWPEAFLPRGFAFTTFGAAALVAIGTFLAVGSLREPSDRGRTGSNALSSRQRQIDLRSG